MNAVPSERPFRVALERVYVWELPVRLVHWLLFFSIVILAATGYYIGNPFFSGQLVMARVREVHLYTSIVFTLCVLVRVYWAFAGNRYSRWSELIPVSVRRVRSLWKSLLFYSFLRREPDEYVGHNALAGLSYAIIFAVYFVMIATGLALYQVYAPFGSPLRGSPGSRRVWRNHRRRAERRGFRTFRSANGKNENGKRAVSMVS